MKRTFDILICSFILLPLIPILIIISLLILMFEGLPIIHWSTRVGINEKIFLMPKFRTMKTNTPDVATHLMDNPEGHITNIGNFLRNYSIDELPQIYSIVIGDMSLVGPRPALHNQDDLIQLRKKLNIHNYKPGVTGWAQINGRDELSIDNKIMFDKYYCENQNFFFDLKILFLTVIKVVNKTGISH